MFLAAALQMTSTGDKDANVRTALGLIEKAVAAGAAFIALPENAVYMGPEAQKSQAAEPLDGPTLQTFAAKAREKHVFLVVPFLEAGGPEGRLYNTSVLFGSGGDRLAIYRKIHLFDADLPDGACYRESETIAPGNDVVVVETPLARVGMAICYDLRFPELFRAQADKGAELLCIPSAFTAHTGKDHWEVLLRARAIENTCFVVAPAQYGQHSERRATWGNALIADPWGRVLARAKDDESMAVALVDPRVLTQVRKEIPCLRHRRL